MFHLSKGSLENCQIYVCSGENVDICETVSSTPRAAPSTRPTSPANTTRRNNSRRRWANIKTSLFQRVVFAESPTHRPHRGATYQTYITSRLHTTRQMAHSIMSFFFKLVPLWPRVVLRIPDTRETRDLRPMLVKCWSVVCDGDPPLIQ